VEELQHDICIGRPYVVNESREGLLLVGVPLDPTPKHPWRVTFYRGPGSEWPASLGRAPEIRGDEIELIVSAENLQRAILRIGEIVDRVNEQMLEALPMEQARQEAHLMDIARREREYDYRLAEAQKLLDNWFDARAETDEENL
jgi:hypothetical protein